MLTCIYGKFVFQIFKYRKFDPLQMRAIYYCPQELVALAFACVKRASALLFGNAQLLRAFNRAISSILVTSHTRKMFVLGKTNIFI